MDRPADTTTTARKADLRLIIGALIAAVCGFAMLGLGSAVSDGDTQKVDERVLLAIRNFRDPFGVNGSEWFNEVVRDITAMGSLTVLTILTASVFGYLLLMRQFLPSVILFAAWGGGLLLLGMLKAYYARPRPSIVPLFQHVSSPSFPSGHSLFATTIFMTLGILLAMEFGAKKMRLYFVAIALFFSFLVGASRVYLGVHYPSDVLAGWVVGLTWAILCWMLARIARRRSPPVQITSR